MIKSTICAVILTALAAPGDAAEATPAQAPKGTICYSNTLAVAGETNVLIACKDLGQFTSIAELYERGYRVVSSGFVPDRRPGFSPFTLTIYLIIEERK